MRLILIRHGQTPANVDGALDTARPGAPLTALGLRQAAALPGALAAEAVTALHASPLLRTQLTADPLATALDLSVAVTEGLEEISAGALEMRSDDDAVAAYADTVAAWIGGSLDVAIPGGPDGHAFVARYDRAVEQMTSGHGDDAVVVAVSHGAAIRTFAARHGGPREDRLLNTGAVVLDGTPGRWQVVRWSGQPLGGAHLADESAPDPTGEPDPV